MTKHNNHIAHAELATGKPPPLSPFVIALLVLVAIAGAVRVARGDDLTAGYQEMTARAVRAAKSLTPYSGDNETTEERDERMTTIGKAAMRSALEWVCANKEPPCWRGHPEDLIRAQLTQVEHESHAALHIHQGKCRDYECDPTRIAGELYHRARGICQVHVSTPTARKYWERLDGTDYESTLNQMRACAASLVRNACGGDVAKMFQAQDGRGCRVGPRGKLRAATFARFREVMRQPCAGSECE